MPSFRDQIGNTIFLEKTPERIISLVPSQTELLVDLGLENELVGITKFCIHPEYIFRSKPRVGGTKNINFDKIRELKPDFIIANKEENQKEQIEELSKEFPVWVSDIYDLNDSFEMMESIGKITEKEDKADTIIKKIKEQKRLFESNIKRLSTKTVAYIIWREPYMLAGRNTFVNKMLENCHLTNIIEEPNSRYPEMTKDELRELNPDLLFLSSEPFPFKEKHIQELSNVIPKERIVLVDGEMFSWYGSRLMKAFTYFTSLKNRL